MSGTTRVAAIDLGASSGRVMVGEVGPDRLELTAVARFANRPLRLPSGLHWNLPGLYAAALGGLREAAAGGPLASIGIDSWAVDHGLLRDGRLLGLPFCYRDEARSEAGPAAVHERIDRPDLYARTGLQFLPFNTLYQLAADPWASGPAATADRMLLVPDLLTFWLTGREVAERTNASTTGLLDPRTGEWDADLARLLGLPGRLLPPLVSPGERIGPLAPHVADEVGGVGDVGAVGAVGAAGVPVVAVGSHDTASAVVGTPLEGPGSAYISLGTWGLVGLELDAPVLTDEARAANVTNEGGVDGTTRFLTNVMGTFVLSECLRTWAAAGDIDDPDADLPGLLRAAAALDVEPPGFDVQDPRFLPPGDLPARIRQWYVERDVPAPSGLPEVVRAIVGSLATAYADALTTVARLAGRRLERVHVVGGGSLNRQLCRAIADRAGLPVLAGPVEATAIGNVLVQARAAGSIGPDLADLRALVARTHPPRTHHPGDLSDP